MKHVLNCIFRLVYTPENENEPETWGEAFGAIGIVILIVFGAFLFT